MKICFWVTLIVICFVTSLPADVYWRDWSEDHSWSSPANWDGSAVPTTSSGTVYIKAGLLSLPKTDPVITASLPDIYRLFIGETGTGSAYVTVETGADLTVTNILRLGHYSILASDVHGNLIINGGVITVGTGGYIDVGDLNTDGTIIMNGGSLITPAVYLPGHYYSNGQINLNAGILTIGTGGLIINNNTSNGQIGKLDMAGGIIVIDGDVETTINNYVISGAITAYGGESQVLCDYNITNTGKTTVWAASYDPAVARYPDPYDNQTEVALDVSLNWEAGNFTVSRDVYLGTDFNEVINAERMAGDLDGNGKVDLLDITILSEQWLDGGAAVNLVDFAILSKNWLKEAVSVFKGNQDANSFDTGSLEYGTTYYWRIDEIDGSNNISKGDVWSFRSEIYVDDVKPGWALMFSDEFNGDFVDETKWVIWNTASVYPGMLSGRWPENVVIENGDLRMITTYHDPPRDGQQWGCGGINTRNFDQQYGYWESRYKINGAYTLNNAFWMDSASPGTPGRFEIDIDEGHYPNKVNMNLHDDDGSHPQSWIYSGDLSQGYHVHGLEWTPTELIWSFDGQVIRRLEHEYCNSSADVKFSTAVLEYFSYLAPDLAGTSMDVDYVRVYKQIDAHYPNPTDGSSGVFTPVELSWQAGGLAAQTYSQVVYFGTDYGSVFNAGPGDAEYKVTQTETTYLPVGLVEGQTYYWRVDQANGTNLWKGDVWSFTTYAQGDAVIIAPELLTGTASGISIYGDRKPEYAVDGSGIAGQAHTTVVDGMMWMTDFSYGWYRVDLGSGYNLNSMKVWNFNQVGYTARGARDIVIYYSNISSDPGLPASNPANWTSLGSFSLTQASGRDDYGENVSYSMPNTIDFSGVGATWVFIDILNTYGGGNYVGLSELIFFSQ